MAHSLLALLGDPVRCLCDCHRALAEPARAQGIRALYRFDDAMRGWGYHPVYVLAATSLFRAQQAAGDPAYRGVAVGDSACSYGRLLGFALHEALHALMGDVSQANYGTPLGAPYGVPREVEPDRAAEQACLDPFNFQEAVAFVGVGPLARALFDIDWALYTVMDVGTYGFVGGNAVVPVPAGFRPVVHIDSHHDPEGYRARARPLEARARDWLTPDKLAELVARFSAAEAVGAGRRGAAWPDPARFVKLSPRNLSRNDPCLCGSGKKVKACHGLG